MSEETKRCSRCGEEKDLRTGFSRRIRNKDGFRTWCKKCCLAYQKEYCDRNREKMRAYYKEYRDRNLEKARACQKKYRDRNRDKVRVSYKRYARSLRGQWASLKKHANCKGWECDISESVFARLRSRPCFYCGAELAVASYGLDRLDSSKGYVKGNVVPCCWSCNGEKGSMPWKDYASIWDMRRSGIPIMESERSYYMLEGYWKLWEEDVSD